jgi:hypothetical protein
MKHRAISALAAATVLAVPLIAVSTSSAAPPTAQPGSGVVRVWNANAVAALANAAAAPVPGAGQSPPVGGIHLAIVQTAVYDAVNAIDGGHQPYLADLPVAAPGASLDAAVATAAYHVLIGLRNGATPPAPILGAGVRAWLDPAYTAAMTAIPNGPSEDDGVAIGLAAAEAMLADRAADGRYAPFQFSTGTGIGEWRPTSGVNDPFAWVANVQPFSLESNSQFRTKGPLDITSDSYAREYNEVLTLGRATGSLRTAEQQALADFFGGNPVVMFNRTLRAVAQAESLSTAAEARLFAMVTMSGADALIGCWEDKEHWSFWRPITAIQNGDDDGNDLTTGEAGWLPFTTNPPYPDHPSGYNCVTGGMMHAAKWFFGGQPIDFTLVLPLAAGGQLERNYRQFTDVVDDTIDARIYMGLHFRTPDEQGAELGADVARWVHQHQFRAAH